MNNELSKICKNIERTENDLSKMKIFRYDTLDEAGTKHERLHSDITVEIGGPSAHIKFRIVTKNEHTKIKNVVQEILDNRLDKANLELDAFCQRWVKDRCRLKHEMLK